MPTRSKPNQPSPAQPSESQPVPTSSVSLDQLRVRLVPPSDTPLASLGDADTQLILEFTPFGAGIESITLTKYFETLQKQIPYSVQVRQQIDGFVVASLAAREVVLNGQILSLFSSGVDDAWVWSQTAPGAFEATIVNANDEPVARITKRFSLKPDSFEIDLDQRIENLTDQPLDVRWIQYGPVDLPADEGTYGGDKRRAFFGHLIDPKKDPTRSFVQPTSQIARQKLIDRAERQLWPASGDTASDEPLVWAAMTNRYFAFAVHTPIPQDRPRIRRWRRQAIRPRGDDLPHGLA